MPGQREEQHGVQPLHRLQRRRLRRAPGDPRQVRIRHRHPAPRHDRHRRRRWTQGRLLYKVQTAYFVEFLSVVNTNTPWVEFV